MPSASSYDKEVHLNLHDLANDSHTNHVQSQAQTKQNCPFLAGGGHQGLFMEAINESSISHPGTVQY